MTMTEPDRASLEPLRGLGAAQRDYAVSGIEVRAATDGSTLVDFYGHASVTNKGYDMYGGPDKGGWTEYVTAGAFKRTLGRKPDVAFLLNHGGPTLARTKPGTLKLAEDGVGLEVQARLDTRVSIVNDIVLLMEAGNLDEMSFAFRVTAQRWLDRDGKKVEWWDLAGVERHIDAVDIDKGDVSVVNYGANPFTDGSLRDLADDDLLQMIEARGPALAARAVEQLQALAPPPPPTDVAAAVVHPDLAARLLSCDLRGPANRLL
jgi:HK97 family phage prohead protease